MMLEPLKCIVKIKGVESTTSEGMYSMLPREKHAAQTTYKWSVKRLFCLCPGPVMPDIKLESHPLIDYLTHI